MRYYPRFPRVIPHQRADYPRVTHPYATVLRDCSPFSFDLHVLGAPPALILSRDQTLVRNDRVEKTPQLYSEILTSSFLLHPTRLSKICAAEIRRHRNGEHNCRPRNLFCRAAFHQGTPTRREKTQNFKKSQTGRPYSAPDGGPPEVLLPFLTRIFILYTTADPAMQVRIATDPPIR